MRAFFRKLLAAWTWLHEARAWASRRRAEVYLTELDDRTIKDIGLEAWRSPLGAEVERRRQINHRGYARLPGECSGQL
ncbi:MAG: hypothetical protein JO292_06075 [Betaproteobacteria bacterium]|nr:hypothetical protein [Betaproteobacteria bacterium]MBV9360941.1 hypothetical protein [Betaproteobacteria bacterium]